MKPAPQREEALFQAATRLNGAERAIFLDGACRGDPVLRQRLEALLAAHEQADDFLATQPEAVGLTVKLDGPVDDAVGLTIGRYKVLEKVGEGGGGVVYVAEQREPVRRRVALKVIKLGMDTKQVVVRFEAERQALAMMDHPNIAKVLDAGTTEGGRAYFVMELQDSSSAGARLQFVTTHWSMVLAACGPLSHQQSLALEALCGAYWYPLYAYIRRAGYGPEDAKDLTQSFLFHLLEKGGLSLADPERGRFRTFLLTALKNYLVDEHRRANALKRGGGRIFQAVEADDGEERYQFEPADLASPDLLYDRGWAKAVLAQALSRLRAEYASSKYGPGFETLKDYVWGERSGVSCAELGRQLGMTEEAVKKAVQRMRHRFGQLLREQVAETVSTPAELEDEIRHLSTLLR
jgi:RNA polymerase sigma-70 factor (ECF subfamily)